MVEQVDREAAAEYIKHGIIDFIMLSTTNAFAAHRLAAAKAERERIVAWLRSGYDTLGMMCGEYEAGELAEAIERGEYER